MMRLSSDDIGLWRRAMRDVIPLRGRAVPPDKNDEPPVAPSLPDRLPPARIDAGAGKMPAVRVRPPVTLPPLNHFAGLDRASAERLRRGRYPIEARLDLHGMTQTEAHRALTGFVSGSRAIGRRVVLVITGHGRISGGILKTAAPRWLNEPDLRRHVLAIAPAQPRDGGSGALYLLLRKALQG
ncbi:MAG: Smr/MutS family protein [Alphaproteobacteria bacterium]